MCRRRSGASGDSSGFTYSAKALEHTLDHRDGGMYETYKSGDRKQPASGEADHLGAALSRLGTSTVCWRCDLIKKTQMMF